MKAKNGDIVWVYGDSKALVLQGDNEGAIVRELDDESETWFPWGDLMTGERNG